MPETETKTKEVKIAEEETTKIRELQSRYTQVTVNLGQVSIASERLQENLDSLDTQKEELLAQHATAQEDERKLVDDLTAKYGIGNLDLDTGIFTPNE
jgi:allophanate hydrolase subunit 1